MRASSSRRPRSARRRLAAAGVLLWLAAGAGPAAAQGAAASAPVPDDCDRAAWPLAAARERLAAASLPLGESGAVLDLSTVPAGELALAPRPAGTDGAPAYGGSFALAVPGPQRVWQITVAAAAWIDVRVDGRALDPVAFTGVHACPGVRKSLRFSIPPGGAVLEISRAAGPHLRIVAEPVP